MMRFRVAAAESPVAAISRQRDAINARTGRMEWIEQQAGSRIARRQPSTTPRHPPCRAIQRPGGSGNPVAGDRGPGCGAGQQAVGRHGACGGAARGGQSPRPRRRASQSGDARRGRRADSRPGRPDVAVRQREDGARAAAADAGEPRTWRNGHTSRGSSPGPATCHMTTSAAPASARLSQSRS